MPVERRTRCESYVFGANGASFRPGRTQGKSLRINGFRTAAQGFEFGFGTIFDVIFDVFSFFDAFILTARSEVSRFLSSRFLSSSSSGE
jgi:hypothetical protein